MEKTQFQEWLEKKGYEIKETVHNEDGTVKTEGTSPDVTAGYFIEFNEERLKELDEARKAENDELVEQLKEQWEANKQEMGNLLAKVIKAVGEHGVALKKLSEVSDGDVSMTNKSSLDLALGDIKEKLTTIKEEKSREEITFKVAGDMTIVGNVSGGNIPIEQREAGVNRIARVKTRIRNFVNSGTAVSNVISWVEQQNPDGSPAGTVEGTLKNQIDFDLVVVDASVKKRTAFIKVSTEMLDDIDFMRTEINSELFERLDLDVDNQVLAGDNTGQNLNGILNQATAFTPGTFATGQPNEVNDPNLVDVLTIAANQIEVANHLATVHIVHPTDLTALKVLKATDNQYVNRLQMVGQTMMLDGIPVISHNGITQDNFLTMDGSRDTVFSKGEIMINIGLDGDDFTKNMRTILAEWRGLNRIKGNDTTAFVTGVISTSIAAIAAS